MAKIVLSARNITKKYPGTKALDNVNFDIEAGKVNVLIGENGAGKSTLMKVIAGIEKPTSGRMFMGDQEICFKDTADAKRHGIGIIHQELSLFPNLKVYQNIFMNDERTKCGVVLDNKRHREDARRILEKLEYPIDVDLQVSDLRVGQQQMIEIARNLVEDNLKILIMDEPTSSLSEQEVEALFKVMRDLLAKGTAIVYISHRLEEIMQIGDNVTIFRNGQLVAHEEIKNVSIAQIVRYMTGRDADYARSDGRLNYADMDTILEVENLTLPKIGGGYLLKDVSFHLNRGEVLGIYGLMGAGRTEVLECLMGLRPEHTGVIKLNGETLKVKDVSSQINKGFALVPEDRQREGLVQTSDIGRNISLSILQRIRRGPFIHLGKEKRAVQKEIDDLRIKVASRSLPILSLSGGNQQKCVIGKGLLTEPKILLLDEPSRGIDIGAKTEVFEIIQKLARDGLSCIVVSSELKEMLSVADRVIVLSNGLLTGEFTGDAINNDNLVLASYKGHHQKKAAGLI